MWQDFLRLVDLRKHTRMSLRSWLTLAFLVLASIVGVMGLLKVWMINDFYSVVDQNVRKNVPIIQALEQLQHSTTRIREEAMSYALLVTESAHFNVETNESLEEEAEEIEFAKRESDQALTTLTTLFESPSDKAILTRLDKLNSSIYAASLELMMLKDDGTIPKSVFSQKEELEELEHSFHMLLSKTVAEKMDNFSQTRGMGDQAAERAIISSLGITLFAVLAALGLGFLLSRRIVKPVVRLSEAAEALGQGSLAPPVEVDSSVEINTLAKCFNQMAQDLAQSATAIHEREQQFRQLAENIRQVFWLVDAKSEKVLYVSPAFEEVWGKSCQSLYDNSSEWTLAIHPTDRTRVEQDFLQQLGKGEFIQEYRIIRPDGTIRYILHRGFPIRDPNGHVYRMAGIAEDVTQQKQAHVLIQKLAAIVESSDDAIIGNTLDGKIQSWNHGAEQLYGYIQQEVLGQHLSMLVPADRTDEIPDFIEQIRQGKQIHNFETVRRAKDGRDIHVSLTLSPIKDADGNVIGVSKISRDITHLKLAESSLSEMVKEVKKSRDDLLSVLNNLELGAVITDPADRVTFVSQCAERLLGQSANVSLGKHWKEIFPLDENFQHRLEEIVKAPSHQREKVLIKNVGLENNRKYSIEFTVQDDPRDTTQRIWLLNDRTDVEDLRRLLLEETSKFHHLIGKSEPMKKVYHQIENLGPVGSTVLITGETGTGKELVARAIHDRSDRAGKPFIAVNCGGLTESVLSSQLFGHKRGAFTGAVADHMGFFESADGGTLFLDEIGDVPVNIQPALLRALETREIARLGESSVRKIDVRLVAATNRDLVRDAEQGVFRHDLLFRIRVARIELPALRHRREDIPLLVSAFLRDCRATTGRTVEMIGPAAMRSLLTYRWTGNVRELKNTIEHAVVHCQGSSIQQEDLPPEISGFNHEEEEFSHDSFSLGVPKTEKAHILGALNQAGGNRVVAAQLLGISRATLFRRLAKLGLTSKQ